MFKKKSNRLTGLSLILSCFVIAGCATGSISSEDSEKSNNIDLSQGVTDKYFATFLAACRDEILDNQEWVDNIYYASASGEERNIFKAAKLADPSVMNSKSRDRAASVLDQNIREHGVGEHSILTLWYYGAIENYDNQKGVAEIKFFKEYDGHYSKYRSRYVTVNDFRKNDMEFDRKGGIFRSINKENRSIHRSIGLNKNRKRVLPYVFSFSSELKPSNYRARRSTRSESGDAALRMGKSAVYTLRLVEAETKSKPKYLLKMKPVGCEVRKWRDGWAGNYEYLTLVLEAYEYSVYSGSESDFSEEGLIYTSF
ncbi:hypothetical protein SAMN05421686_10237 [Thalassolituus maritimus]|uniref:Lipoprotein n=1 Tax=Thalassolituus maritimus TaxID=484498 RepID=A0A1N7JIK2_9GAMM|nr:hypothetical protein [Thalassolituus maritimus]SIS49157.1 hypothetical protein SAMN05421686_10237 [Thalassolituus maritimus]